MQVYYSVLSRSRCQRDCVRQKRPQSGKIRLPTRAMDGGLSDRMLQERLAPVFPRFFHLVQELMGDGAVDHAVIIAQRHITHGADGDGVVDDDRALFDGAEAENADVGLTDYRQSE